MVNRRLADHADRAAAINEALPFGIAAFRETLWVLFHQTCLRAAVAGLLPEKCGHRRPTRVPDEGTCGKADAETLVA